MVLPSCSQLDSGSKVLHVVQETLDPHDCGRALECRESSKRDGEFGCELLVSSGYRRRLRPKKYRNTLVLIENLGIYINELKYSSKLSGWLLRLAT